MPTAETWNDTPRLLGFTIIIAFILVIVIWLFHAPTGDAGSLAVLNMLMGSLAAMATGVVTYYFGSSKGSKDKDDTISSIARAENGTGTGTTSTATVTAPTATAPGSATVTTEPSLAPVKAA